MNSYGWCTSDVLSDDLQYKCDNEDLTLVDITLEVMNMYPMVPFAFIQSKTDAVQRSFYSAIAVTGNICIYMHIQIFYHNAPCYFMFIVCD